MKTVNIVPVTQRICSDLLTPVSLFLRLKGTHTPFFLLESIGDEKDLGRYSYVGMDPVDLESLLGSFPLDEADAVLKRLVCHPDAAFPNLLSGVVGHVAYHSIETVFPIKLKTKADIPSHHFFLAQGMAVLDHLNKDLILVRNLIDPTPEAILEAQGGLDSLAAVLTGPETNASFQIPQASGPLVFKSSFTKSDFLQAVGRAKEYIHAGDVFQVVLSQQFSATGSLEGFDLYRHLRRANPAPYMSYIRFPGFEALCSSPEMLVRMDPSSIETVPIAGTRPVLNDGLDDQRAAELLQDPKELAEHLMLVDLGRNDLGKVSLPGTVEVTDYCSVQLFSRVMHLVSKVRGIPKPGTGLVEGMLSAFPAGTVTGAPKLRAMEIIDELEPVPRGLYAGAIVIMDPQGRLNSCIAIRTITLKQDTVTLQAGAGIVYDSDPETEYEETLNKARALFNAIEASTTGGVTYDFSD